MGDAVTSHERTVELPALGPLYAQAARQAVAAKLSRGRRGDALPETVLVSENVSPDREADRRLRETAGGRAGEHASAEYLHVLGFPLAVKLMLEPDFPLPVLGMVHLVNEVEYVSPVEFDDVLTVRARAERLAPHSAGTRADVVVEMLRGDELVFSSRATNLARGVFLAGKAEKQPQERLELSGRTAQWALGADAGRAWAGVSGDYNPIHLSALSAKALGMPSAIAHGMYTASRALESSLPPGVEAGFRWTVRFMAPVRLPGRVDLRIDVERGAPERFEGSEVSAVRYTGWSAKAGKPHFTGSVEPLGASGNA